MSELDLNVILPSLISLLPNCFLFAFVIILALIFRSHLSALFSRLTKLGVLGFDLEFGEQVRNQLELAFQTYATKDDLVIDDVRLNSVLNHAKTVNKYLSGARILWVDRAPLANANIHRFLNDLGVNIDNTDSTEQALAAMKWSSGAYEVIITNGRRADGDDAGLKLIANIHAMFPTKQIILFISKDPENGTPEGCRVVTNQVDTLLHHVFDSIVLERTKKEKPT
ncbi:MAG: hypothetical protein IPO91_31975 [Chloroflexi bacterium]|nr:hypothetical protein [Chloroflexota bacterium]